MKVEAKQNNIIATLTHLNQSYCRMDVKMLETVEAKFENRKATMFPLFSERELELTIPSQNSDKVIKVKILDNDGMLTTLENLAYIHSLNKEDTKEKAIVRKYMLDLFSKMCCVKGQDVKSVDLVYNTFVDIGYSTEGLDPKYHPLSFSKSIKAGKTDDFTLEVIADIAERLCSSYFQYPISYPILYSDGNKNPSIPVIYKFTREQMYTYVLTEYKGKYKYDFSGYHSVTQTLSDENGPDKDLQLAMQLFYISMDIPLLLSKIKPIKGVKELKMIYNPDLKKKEPKEEKVSTNWFEEHFRRLNTPENKRRFGCPDNQMLK